jgi:hypothetical protein
VRPWQINLGGAAGARRDQPLQLRVKFNAAQKSLSGTYLAAFVAGGVEQGVWRSGPMSLAPDTFHELNLPAGLLDTNGVLAVEFFNPNDTALLFPLEDGMEVLYAQGGFGLNYARGLGIILCWMALLAALGLAAASFLSFPVAAFVSLAALVVGLSSGTLANAVETGTIAGMDEESGVVGKSLLDSVAIPAFKGALVLINLVKDFSPVDALSTGRVIGWGELGRAAAQIVFLLGGVLAAFGMFVFSRRELATAQGTQ